MAQANLRNTVILETAHKIYECEEDINIYSSKEK